MGMTQLQADQDGLARDRPAQPAPNRWQRILTRGLTVLAIIVATVFLQLLARKFWHEWVSLQSELRQSTGSEVVGYLDIQPRYTHARPPANLFRNEGAETLMWSSWVPGVGHHWFRFKQGEIDTGRISRSTGYATVRVIDYPLVETRGGAIWRRIPSEAAVVGCTLQGQNCVYPTDVLSNVQVINDLVHDHPFLILDNLLAPGEQAFSVFEASLEGRRLTMGITGYSQDGKPLLFDRGTESLWVEDSDNLLAIGGKYNQKRLPRVARLVPVSWSSWQSRNQESRLVVGADRSRGVPSE